MMSATYETFNMLIENIMVSCRGWLDAIAVVSEDGTPIAYNANIDFRPEFIAAATAAIGGAISAVIELLNAKSYEKVDIQLQDKRYLIIRSYKSHYVVGLTKPNPNLGFINLILEAYLSGRA